MLTEQAKGLGKPEGVGVVTSFEFAREGQQCGCSVNSSHWPAQRMGAAVGPPIRGGDQQRVDEGGARRAD